MNKNLPQTIKTIRSILGGAGDVATAIAYALDGQGLLVDPERTFGTVLRRTRDGWVPVTPLAPAPAPSLAEAVTAAQRAADASLEEQARTWDRACQRARTLAGGMARQYAAEPDVNGVTADRDTVVVSLHITDAARWAAWMNAFGLTDAQLLPVGDYAVCGRTSWDGTPLSVLAYDVPELQAAAMARAARPYLHDGVVYDLAIPHQDRDGDVWYHHGSVLPDGMPLLSIDGRPERCTLAGVIRQVGPLNPVRELTAVSGGEDA